LTDSDCCIQSADYVRDDALTLGYVTSWNGN